MPAPVTPRLTPSKRHAQRRRRTVAYLEGRLDAEDSARALIGFRGNPPLASATMRYVRAASDGEACAYVFDEDSGMVYILD